jgi:hypothetical protein
MQGLPNKGNMKRGHNLNTLSIRHYFNFLNLFVTPFSQQFAITCFLNFVNIDGGSIHLFFLLIAIANDEHVVVRLLVPVNYY